MEPGSSCCPASRDRADPEAFRPQWVNPATFWPDLEKALALSPKVGHDDQPMADQARTLLALYNSDPAYKALLDDVAGNSTTSGPYPIQFMVDSVFVYLPLVRR